METVSTSWAAGCRVSNRLPDPRTPGPRLEPKADIQQTEAPRCPAVLILMKKYNMQLVGMYNDYPEHVFIVIVFSLDNVLLIL